MDLNYQEERIIKTVEELGPDHIYNSMFQDSKSQAALTRLIREGLVRQFFSAKEGGLSCQYQAGRPINREAFDLHFGLTEKGWLYADHIYLPNVLFSRRLLMVTTIICLVVMVGIALWLI